MQEKIDLLLVNPGNRLEQFAQLSELATVGQPLGIAMLAAHARQAGFSVAVIDAEAEFWTPERTVEEMERYDPVLVGLSAFTTKMTAAGKILRLHRARRPDVRTVIGGHHSSAIPEQTLEEEAVDYVIRGEGFTPIVALLTALRAGDPYPEIRGLYYRRDGRIAGTGRATPIACLDVLPFPAWDLLPMEKYRAHHWQTWDYNLQHAPFALIYTSLGCPFSCEYCSVNVVYGKNATRYRRPERVVDEIRLLVERYGVRDIEIIDDTFTLNQKRVEALCDQIIASGLGDVVNMWCFSRVDRVDRRFLGKMKRAGINWVFMGLESGDDLVLQGVNKKQTVDQIRRAVDTVQESGIHVGGNYVFGLPSDTMRTMQQTIDLAQDLNTEYANFFLLMPYPGTELHTVAKEKGYPLPERWGQYGFFAPDALPMRNETLTSEQILAFRDQAFTAYFGSQSYQSMIREVFGQQVVDFIRERILTRSITRTPAATRH